MANIDQPEFDEPRGQPGFRCRRARLGRQLGTEKLGEGGGIHMVFGAGDAVDYYEGEQPP